jgi:hypothetical protein
LTKNFHVAFDASLDIEAPFIDSRIGYVGAGEKALGMHRDVRRTKQNLFESERNTESIGRIVYRTADIENWVKSSILRYETNVPDLCSEFPRWLRKIIEGLGVKQRVSVLFRKQEPAVKLAV